MPDDPAAPPSGQPPADPAGAPGRPPTTSGDPKPPEGDPAKGKESADELRAALDAERKANRETQSKLAKLEKDLMSDQEKAVADAKKQGHDEALLVAGKRLAAAEFRAAAAGRLTDPAAALDVLDLSKFVGEDGEPDNKAIAAVVDKLAAGLAPVAPPNGRVPAGARSSSTPEGRSDQWLRDSIER